MTKTKKITLTILIAILCAVLATVAYLDLSGNDTVAIAEEADSGAPGYPEYEVKEVGSADEFVSYWNGSASYTLKLTDDITLSEVTLNDLTIAMALDLNDHLLNLSKNIIIGSGGHLTLEDNATEKTTRQYDGYDNSGNTIQVEITGGCIVKKSTCIYLSDENANLTFVSGNIVFGSVEVEKGSFEMSGGTISCVKSTSPVKLTYNGSGHFEMSGGTISNNNTSNGSGVSCGTGASFNMSGGTIRDNYSCNYG